MKRERPCLSQPARTTTPLAGVGTHTWTGEPTLMTPGLYGAGLVGCDIADTPGRAPTASCAEIQCKGEHPC